MARGLFALVGLAAVLVVALPASRGALVAQAVSAATAVDAAEASPAAAVLTAERVEPVRVSSAEAAPAVTGEQLAIAEFIGRRYRVADSASEAFVAAAFRAGREFSVDPLLILAVMAIESRYNPVAESSMGAMGLMQIIPRFHPEKLADHGGEAALLEPEINIRVGTWVLHEYMRRFGDVEAALLKYAGALDDPASQYADKVLAEKARLQQIVARSRRQT
ncbi:MAG: transglycosylase SLT domain-containing protein [Betaproteobacteria bacterium]|nr:transglycosylase SLT domain-containing protein [Betaproteobacteria bacterium]MDH5220460.1 transglycosylase SLT domain-containing protein [Betaproteobacteria bacterium]MDH5349551.1 transglycosylase SLT domain-containing protein [Betaproteobacteria bacterium]